MIASEQPRDSNLESQTSARKNKLALAYFTQSNFCPAMVRQKARGAFELFLCLARCWLDSAGQPVSPSHEELCRACGIDPKDRHARSAISRLLRVLRARFHVIDFEPAKRRRPKISVVSPPGEDALNPTHYIYFDDGWNAGQRAVFASLGTRAFAAEYMYLVAKYESALARRKHGRSYWFYPLDRIAKAYHISARFAGVGLRGLVELGAMHVTHGQFGIVPRENEFGRANRYYFQGLGAVYRRKQEHEAARQRYGQTCELAMSFAGELTNGATTKNVVGLCELLENVGEQRVTSAIGELRDLPRRSLKRRLAYVRALCAGEKPEPKRHLR